MPDLTGMPSLDVAIGLAFIFLLLSLLASTLQEAIAAIFGLRARTLEEGIRNMLGSDGADPLKWVSDFYSHPLIASLYRGDAHPASPPSGPRLLPQALKPTRGPSYISPRAFASALLDLLFPPGDAPALAGLEEKIAGLPEPLRKRLAPLARTAGGDIDAFRQAVEAWYDDTMARVSGWYKRKTQLILLCIAVVVVVALNANTLTMGGRLWSNQAVRAAVVQQAGQASSQPTGADARTRLDNAAANVASVTSIGVPLGWSDSAKPHWGGTGFLEAIGGWLLTVLAISLGAPFWFDTLSRISRLRSSGKPETPLPASGSGSARERIVTERPSSTVVLQVAPPPLGDGTPTAAGGTPAPQ